MSEGQDPNDPKIPKPTDGAWAGLFQIIGCRTKEENKELAMRPATRWTLRIGLALGLALLFIQTANAALELWDRLRRLGFPGGG